MVQLELWKVWVTQSFLESLAGRRTRSWRRGRASSLVPYGLLGAVEGLSFLRVLAIVVIFGLKYVGLWLYSWPCAQRLMLWLTAKFIMLQFRVWCLLWPCNLRKKLWVCNGCSFLVWKTIGCGIVGGQWKVRVTSSFLESLAGRRREWLKNRKSAKEWRHGLVT